jgi:hypothetical protein
MEVWKCGSVVVWNKNGHRSTVIRHLYLALAFRLIELEILSPPNLS